MRENAVAGLEFKYDLVVNDEIGKEMSDMLIMIMDIKLRLLSRRDAESLKLKMERPVIDVLGKRTS